MPTATGPAPDHQQGNGLLDQICRHISTGKAAVGQQVGSRGVEVVSDLGQRVTGVVQEAVELGLDGCCVGLVVNPVTGYRRERGALGGVSWG